MFFPLPIQPFGTSIVIGILAAYGVLKKRPALAFAARSELTTHLVRASIWASIIGGRTLYWLVHSHEHAQWTDVFMLHKGGMSSQGALLGVLAVLAINAIMHGRKIVTITDALASCAPLVQAIARIGCFFAGCCYGSTCSYPWAITYHSTHSFAPLWTPLHPAQLYSATMLICIFLTLQAILPRTIKYPGLTTTLYLLLTAIARFVVEFFRGESISYSRWLTVHQCVALLFAGTSLLATVSLLILYIWYDKNRFSSDKIKGPHS